MKKINQIVQKIIEDVKDNGDFAVRNYSIDLSSFLITKEEINKAYKKVGKETISALKFAKKNIEFFARQQLKQLKNFEVNKNGVTLGQRVIPIGKIGVYVPGGNYPLPSTALMCIVPAKLAGVKEIIVCSPKIKPETIVAADIAGADKIFKIGGVQAIAAMAYGTKQVPKVDKIVGPGNIYVTAAKKAVYGDCGIDLPAGPSEVLVIADRFSDCRFIASDLIAQLEHDANSVAILVTDSKIIAKKVSDEIRMMLKRNENTAILGKSIRNLKINVVKTVNDAIKIANDAKPEHLELLVNNPEKYVNKLVNYGSLFIGEYSAVAFGDYCSGTNHVLPTSGAAKFSGGLSIRDFVKFLTYQKISRSGAIKLSKAALIMSRIEGLENHNRSVRIRTAKQ